MITLITGIPGMGKTALLVQMLLELEKDATRPLFVMGIPDLKLEHTVAPPVNEWTELRTSPEDATLQLAYFTFPPNSILIVDECQRVYRPRSSSSKVPDYVAALETHRHTGLDIILLTQKPKLVDVNVRELVGKHIHIRAGFIGRYLYEWPHVADGESRLDRSDAAKRKFSPPKEAFKFYKSAELHTKHKFRIHNIFYIASIAFAVLAFQGYKSFQLFQKKIHPEQVQADSTAALLPSANATQLDSKLPTSDSSRPVARFGAQDGANEGHPYHGFDFSINGYLKSKKREIYNLVAKSETSELNITSERLQQAGYALTPVTDCLLLIQYPNGFSQSIICKETQAPEGRAVRSTEAFGTSPHGLSAAFPAASSVASLN